MVEMIGLVLLQVCMCLSGESTAKVYHLHAMFMCNAAVGLYNIGPSGVPVLSCAEMEQCGAWCIMLAW
jgi:hypothetical protein